MAATRVTTRSLRATDRLSRGAERLLRTIGDGRVGLGLLAAAGVANAAAALLPDGPALLGEWPYALLLGVLTLSAVAAAAVRVPATWREWRHPGPTRPGPGAVESSLDPAPEPDTVERALQGAGYRTRRERVRGGWAIHGVRRGWSRFAGQTSHLAFVLIVIGTAIGAAFGSETTFSLLPGDQALLDTPRAGFSSAVRLESLEAEFGPDGRARRLDTAVTFLRDGAVVRGGLLRVNEPGAFDGYLVHPWSYGPAARVRVTTLAGGTLLDAAIPLQAETGGALAGSVQLPTAGLTLGLALADATANELGISVVGADGLVEVARLQPGDEVRLGALVVSFSGFDAWVTFLSRSDPGLGVLFAGAALLCVSLAITFWLPRRRLTVRPHANAARIVLRGERFDRPAAELERIAERLGARA